MIASTSNHKSTQNTLLYCLLMSRYLDKAPILEHQQNSEALPLIFVQKNYMDSKRDLYSWQRREFVLRTTGPIAVMFGSWSTIPEANKSTNIVESGYKSSRSFNGSGKGYLIRKIMGVNIFSVADLNWLPKRGERKIKQAICDDYQIKYSSIEINTTLNTALISAPTDQKHELFSACKKNVFNIVENLLETASASEVVNCLQLIGFPYLAITQPKILKIIFGSLKEKTPESLFYSHVDACVHRMLLVENNRLNLLNQP